ncbi:hypothetical protein KGY14_00120 [Ameyamaea chiangmaiensis]|uniref:Uncharacterized protein n=1 Tax=Ameyamaea chiangmaiensis TaxID=442969 RepID=A0A850PCU5_9PROT|nr:hypothetical protein [Ameyamaea chiangmaiensis]MBS4073589.1 hypothetical protein [Ameyamaea chiangmaiensis]NVN40469.1 hypothetical protein [Ameyamaea chiangmaiensis]
MKRVILMSASLSLVGCSGFGKFVSDTATLPGANPNAPQGGSENMLRARGYAAASSKLQSEPGNIWPDAPQPLPTLEDVSRNPASLDALLRANGAVAPSGPQMPDDGSMTLGESTKIHNGVQSTDFNGPGLNVPSQDTTAARFGAQPSNASIVIPNGDGSSTIIAPDGSVRTVRNGATSVH